MVSGSVCCSHSFDRYGVMSHVIMYVAPPYPHAGVDLGGGGGGGGGGLTGVISPPFLERALVFLASLFLTIKKV